MSRLSSLLLVAALVAPTVGCDKVRAVVCEPVKKPTAKASASDAGEPDETARKKAVHNDEEPANAHAAAGPDGGAPVLTAGAQSGFALPFAWEKSPQEPLARARTFLREVADDNKLYMDKGPAFFHAFANTQTPRATVVACADSRVQAGAFDATPENDDFTIRNIGNQVENGLGSIQYGIDHLHTPVLLILGHTGCGAIKAAMEDTSELPEPIRRELATLHPEKAGKAGFDEHKWLAAVLANVHDQVKSALRSFGPRVNAGELTIVGAIYDFRNELGKGAGRLAVIDVNGVEDPVRLQLFVEAIMSGPGKSNSLDPMERLARALADPGPASEQSDDSAP